MCGQTRDKFIFLFSFSNSHNCFHFHLCIPVVSLPKLTSLFSRGKKEFAEICCSDDYFLVNKRQFIPFTWCFSGIKSDKCIDKKSQLLFFIVIIYNVCLLWHHCSYIYTKVHDMICQLQEIYNNFTFFKMIRVVNRW